jgi:hypothetical protein
MVVALLGSEWIIQRTTKSKKTLTDIGRKSNYTYEYILFRPRPNPISQVVVRPTLQQDGARVSTDGCQLLHIGDT